MAIYGYARVSSKGQERYGNSLTDQQNQLLAAGCAPDHIYHDSYTGTKMDRPQFSTLLSVLAPGDTLVVTKLDRFARTAADGAKTIQDLLARDVSVNILNMGKADNTPMGKLLLTVLLAFAEFERDMIVERTSAGKVAAKSKDPSWREGRLPIKLSKEDVERYRHMAKTKQLTVQQCCDRLHIARSTWYKLIKEGRL